MKELLRKIRQILQDRKTRRFFTRVVSSVAAIVVFVTTYALILPAITLEKTASCGIEEHQHSDSCYEERLVCGQKESDGHQHDDSCYTSTTELTCGSQEHRHSSEKGCYDADGNLVCELQEHVHDDSCYEEVRVLTCGREEYKGHQHTDACYEKVLTCGKEVHTHSGKCYGEIGSTDAVEAGNSAGNSYDSAGSGDNVNTGNTWNTVPEVSDYEAVAGKVQPDSYVPELEPLDMEAMLNGHTDFYYYHAGEGEEVPADSTEITNWKKVEEETVLELTDLVKAYLAYTIPAGSLNESNPSVRYRIPENLHLSDEQIEAMNRYENGIAAGYRDSDAAAEKDENGKDKEDNYKKYLGAEAVEGDRRPDEKIEEGAQEYISAVVRAENVYDDKGKYMGQDLIFTFVPYSIEKNQDTYDADKTLISAGKKITGWFAYDLRLDQIEWESEEDNKEKENIEEDNKGEENKEELNKDEGNSEDINENINNEKNNESIADRESAEKTARAVFVEENQKKDIEEISRVLKMTGEVGDGASAGTQNEQSFKAGSLTVEGDDYKINLDYSKEAKIPENAFLSVCEITAETDKEAYEACLEQAGQQVAADDKTSVDRKTSRFFDIQILARYTDSDGREEIRKIEPSAPVIVNIQIIDNQAANDNVSNVSADQKTGQGDPSVLHFAEEGVEQLDATVKEGQEQVEDKDRGPGKESELAGSATEISFEAESFSVYAIVYTVDFEYSVNGKKYQFSLPGGGFTSFTDIVEMLGILGDRNNENNETDIEEKIADGIHAVTASDAVKKFVADVESVRFSSPELVWVGKADVDTTVGVLKKANGLECVYSAELTEKQIERINSTAVESGDWALISMQPFDSEETMTVTMTDGEIFTIQVTDAQIQTMFLSDSGELFEVTVTYDEAAKIPEGSTLRVTEFSKEDTEYEYARNSVLADKKARGEWVDLDSFGLAALDISILDADGNKIEPSAPVRVDMTIKALPSVENLDEIADTLAIQHHLEVDDGVVVETVFNGNADASFKLEMNETAASEGIVVDPNSVKEEDFAAPVSEKTNGLNIEFEAAAFSTFTISWNNAYGNGVKVHYVDENGTDLNVKNSTFLSNLNGSSTSPAYLIYDIDGYEYDHTYRRYYSNKKWLTQDILPQLKKHNASYSYGDNWNGWQYTDGSTDYWGNHNWYTLSSSNAANKDEIYIVYKKKADIAQGGTPTVKPSGSVDPPAAPRINKESTPNGDDTNTLALSLISDTAKLEVEKLADVIVVFDVSGSMSTKDMGNNATRLAAAKTAVKDLATHLSEKVNSDGEPLVRMSLIKFSTKASTVLGMTDLTKTGSNNGLSQIKNAVDGLSANGGTNWDHALQLANEENDLDSGRATFVIFVTDGDPTFRNTRMDVTDLQLQGETNDQALNVYGQESPNPWYLEDNVYGPGDNDKTGKCYDAAVGQGNAIVSAGKNIYTIGISNDVTKVKTFNTAIHGNGAYLAGNTNALNQAFADIEASISGASGWGNIRMTDGITNLTNTVQKTGLTNVGGDFSYWIAPAPADWSRMTEAQKKSYTPDPSAFVSWDPKAAGAELAEYNTATGAVEWNMGSSFMPEAGVTYQVRFKVWPRSKTANWSFPLTRSRLP